MYTEYYNFKVTGAPGILSDIAFPGVDGDGDGFDNFGAGFDDFVVDCRVVSSEALVPRHARVDI